MGLFSSFKNVVNKSVALVQKAPLPSALKGFVAQIKGNKPEALKQYTTSLKSTALFTSIAIPIAKPAQALSVAKALIPKTVTQFINRAVVGLTAPAIISAVISHPQEVAKAPASVYNFEKNAIALGINPSVENLKTLAKENPLVTTLLGLGLSYLAVKGAGPTVSTLYAGHQVSEQTQAYKQIAKETSRRDRKEAPRTMGTPDIVDYKAQKELLEAQTKSTLAINEQTYKQQKEMFKIQQQAVPVPLGAPASAVVAPKVKKKRKKRKKKAKKKTRRSKKKGKKKKKSIKRRKTR